MIMRCPSCGADNPSESRTCFRCNAILTSTEVGRSRHCISCGRTISWDANVCPYCGHDFRAPQITQVIEPISSGMKILFYILSFLIPLAGFIIGAIYWTKPDEPSKHVGKMCIIFAIVGILLSVGLAAVLYVMVLGFGGQVDTTPALVIVSRSTISNGLRFALSQPTISVVWDDIAIELSTQVSVASWHPHYDGLAGSGLMTDNLGAMPLGSMTVYCSVSDLIGNGFINNADYFELTTSGTPTFSPSTTYSLTIIYEPTGGQMASMDFQG